MGDFDLAAFREERRVRREQRLRVIEAHLAAGGLAVENERTVWGHPPAPGVTNAHYRLDSARELAEHLENRESFWGPVHLVSREEAEAWIASKRAAYRERAGADALTREELVEVLRGRGFTHAVMGFDRMVPLDAWRPYGVDDVNGPDNPIAPLLFKLREDGSAVDYADPEGPVGPPFVLGVFRFTTLTE